MLAPTIPQKFLLSAPTLPATTLLAPTIPQKFLLSAPTLPAIILKRVKCMTANAVTTLTGSYRTTRKLVSDETDARIGRCGCSCLPTRAAKGGLGARRDGHKFCRDGHETDKGHLEYRKDHRRATLRLSVYSVRAAEDCALSSAGSALPSAGSALPSAGSAMPSGCYAAAIHLVVMSYGEIGKKMRERVPQAAALGNEKSVSTLPVDFVYTLL